MSFRRPISPQVPESGGTEINRRITNITITIGKIQIFGSHCEIKAILPSGRQGKRDRKQFHILIKSAIGPKKRAVTRDSSRFNLYNSINSSANYLRRS